MSKLRFDYRYAVFIVAFIIDAINLIRLFKGDVSGQFISILAVGVIAAVLLNFVQERVFRISLWVVLTIALFVVSVLSNGTNLSLWAWLGLLLGPVTVQSRRLITAAVFAAIHAVLQFILLPLPLHQSSPIFLALVICGFGAFAVWHQWQKSAAP
ncbi:MAG: hypothetical protein C7B45_10110 [Sulfobacillus acidophilus]|uniref:Uncharacterized protein n=1 Tax=Sulfobacillus acidophilus TaxID=53633 RepID=A0A2T2WHD8_9FIRM|nr:MAG: hypothetical protein C7B45_10110 [Sulfobacillus acidophilus]